MTLPMPALVVRVLMLMVILMSILTSPKSLAARIDPRSIGPVMLEASGPTGQYGHSKTWPESAYHCKPWELPSTNEDPKSEFACYFNSAEWMPFDVHIIKDFLSADVPSIFEDKLPNDGWSIEHTVSHWAISYKETMGIEGDCAYGTWLIRERNISHIPNRLPEIYQNLHAVNCNGTYEIRVTQNKQYMENIERFEEHKPLKEVNSADDYQRPPQTWPPWGEEPKDSGKPSPNWLAQPDVPVQPTDVRPITSEDFMTCPKGTIPGTDAGPLAPGKNYSNQDVTRCWPITEPKDTK